MLNITPKDCAGQNQAGPPAQRLKSGLGGAPAFWSKNKNMKRKDKNGKETGLEYENS